MSPLFVWRSENIASRVDCGIHADDAVDMDNTERLRHFAIRAGNSHPSAGLFHCAIDGDDEADSGAIGITQLADVQDELSRALTDQTANIRFNPAQRAAEPDRADQFHNVDVGFNTSGFHA